MAQALVLSFFFSIPSLFLLAMATGHNAQVSRLIPASHSWITF